MSCVLVVFFFSVSLLFLLLLKQAFYSTSGSQPAMSLTYRSHKILLSIWSNFASCSLSLCCERVCVFFFHRIRLLLLLLLIYNILPSSFIFYKNNNNKIANENFYFISFYSFVIFFVTYIHSVPWRFIFRFLLPYHCFCYCRHCLLFPACCRIFWLPHSG